MSSEVSHDPVPYPVLSFGYKRSQPLIYERLQRGQHCVQLPGTGLAYLELLLLRWVQQFHLKVAHL